MKLLHHDSKATDPLYHDIQKDRPHLDQPSLLRDRVESLYETCHELVDEKFPSQIKHAVASCYSELYFCTTFIKRLGMIVTHPSDKGPDYYLQSLDCWAEIVTMSNGDKSKPNSISGPELNVLRDGFADEDKIMLRVTSCFKDKADKILTYIENGIISSSQRIIICINGGWIEPFFRFPLYPEGSFPAVVKALLGIGDMVLFVNRAKMTVDEITFNNRDHIIKKDQTNAGAAIKTDYFIDPQYAYISGVLYSYANVKDSIEAPDLGSDFYMIHNPFAANPLPWGSFKCGIEYKVKDIGTGINITILEHESKS